MKSTRQAKEKQGSSSTVSMDMENQNWDIKSIMKDIEFLGSSHMTWKERKELENKKVVSLGGKPPKKQRLPLSVARPRMKKQKERDQKMLEQRLILGRFGGHGSGSTNKHADRRKPDDGVLKSTEGFFRNGVLDVKHLLQPSTSRSTEEGRHVPSKGKKKKGGKKNHSRKGGNRKRH